MPHPETPEERTRRESAMKDNTYVKREIAEHLEAIQDLLGGEPIFLLRARSKLDRTLLVNWITEAQRLEGLVPQEKIDSAKATLREFEDWPHGRYPD